MEEDGEDEEDMNTMMMMIVRGIRIRRNKIQANKTKERENIITGSY